MGVCEKANLSNKVICCPGKVQLIVLSGTFFLFAGLFGGLLYWQVPVFIDFMESSTSTAEPPFEPEWWYSLMAIPGLMLLSSMGLFAMLFVNPKILLVICTCWPALTSLIPAACGTLFVYGFVAGSGSTGQKVDEVNRTNLYILYIVPAGAVTYIICAIYCIVLLVCLACCQRAGAGHDVYECDKESAEDIEDQFESHISLQ